MKRFRGELVFKADGLLYHSTLGLRVIEREETAFEMVYNVHLQGGAPGARRGDAPAALDQHPNILYIVIQMVIYSYRLCMVIYIYNCM